MIALLLSVLAAAATPAAADGGPMKLREGAGGKLCLQCHADFARKLENKVVHTPVRTRECIACHDPHASTHGKLLASDPKAVCVSCHQGAIPAQAKSVHQPVRDGACVGCHDPHASQNPSLLVQAGSQVCASCHKRVVDGAAAAKFPHQPVVEGCATCHEPHASASAGQLLRSAEPKLCLGCHKADASLSKAHLGYPVAQASCTSCHDPHGSNKKGMLFDNVHQPVATKMCSQCHLDPRPGKPVALRQQGAALCKECHSARMDRMMDKALVHWAIADETACLHCHAPHASREPKLVAARMDALCSTCHADTIARQQRSPTKHAPVRDGKCTACHDPHASENVLLMKVASVNESCGTCHDWQRHATHPIGDQVKDPRNRNLTLDCLSCHRAHGTEYKNMAPYPTITDLCTKCHAGFKR